MDLLKIEKLIVPLLEQESAELVDVSYAKEGSRWVLRVYVDKSAGVTLDDCAYLSERIGSLIDSQNAIAAAYVLEVSSPGIDRVIRKEKDFKRFVGKPVKIRLKEAVGERRNFSGAIKNCEGGRVTLDCEGSEFSFGLSEVEEARLNEVAGLSL